MNSAFILHSLKTLTGDQNPMNKWQTLHNQVQRIGMLGDNNVGVSVKTRMFYFDTNSECLYIRYLDGDPQPSATVPEGYVGITVGGQQYIIKISKDANTSNQTIGAYHSCISFDNICAFYYQNDTAQLQRYLDEMRG